MAAFRRLVRVAYAPAMILGLNAAGFWLVTSHYSYGWLALVLIGAFALTYLAERISPAYEEWNQSHGDEAATALHALVYEISSINGVLLIPVIIWMFPVETIWPTQWPMLLQLLLALAFADFFFMFMHYLSHRWSILWRLHAVHHGVPRLHGFNGLVRHPLHQTIDMIVGTAPLVILGMPVEVALLLGLAVSIQLIVQHSNVDYALGPFRNLLSIGQLHHLHHVNWGKEGDCNFGLFLTLWDRILGTFVPEPSRRIKANDMGIDEVPDFPKSYWQQLIFPFVYRPGAGLTSPAAAKTAPMPSSRPLDAAE